ncbi:MAG: 3-hydroxyacyl-CoA dehydrogenase [Proteobacteria bacterium]|nr:3-hydroxyacyl-CoA dehydrogenase [Pseudomonadota bacterium]
MEIKRAAVIGAGVMGSGIAAHIANAGVPVLLLDIVPKDAAPDKRSAIAEGALARLLKTDPAPFMHKRNARLVSTGNIEDDLDKLADCDWIVEAVLEDPKVKRDLYGKIDKHRKKGSVVSSNTSTLPLAVLTEGMSDAFTADFLVTHFFNPPRYMRLLEIVAGSKTRSEAVGIIRHFCDHRLGKGVVDAKDTPGFIANRLGVFWIECAVVEALDGGLTVEEADAIMGRPMGIPKTGVFGLLDLVGLDLSRHVAREMAASLPGTDAYLAIKRDVPLFEKLIADGYTGRKGKGGFYRLNREGGGREKEAIDLQTGEFAPALRPRLESIGAAGKDLRRLLEFPDKTGQYGWRVLSQVLCYAASLIPEIADDVAAADEAMRLGYAWKEGPFQIADRIGVDWLVARLEEEGRDVPPLLARAAEAGGFYRTEGGQLQFLTVDGEYADLKRREGVLLLEDIKRASEPVKRNASASLWDIGDGILCLEFHSKMNSLDQESLKMVEDAVKIVPKAHKGLVIYNEGSNFSVGANIGLALFAANLALWPMIEDLVATGQRVYKALKYAPFPVVGAPSGMALGGACEILMHCDAIQAHAETYTGLVEVGVGVVPGWGGCKEMVTRWATATRAPKGPMPPVAKAFESIGTAKVAKSAMEAQDMMILREGDRITMNRDRLLADAKARAIELSTDYAPPQEAVLHLPGATGRAAIEMAVRDFELKGMLTPHDRVVVDELKKVLTGGDTDIVDEVGEDALLKLERDAFMKLIRHPGTLARVEHMLDTGKPLRN